MSTSVATERLIKWENFTYDKEKGAIFDMDGTLLDSMWVWRQIDVDFLGRRGFEVPSDYLEMITPMGYYRGRRVYD